MSQAKPPTAPDIGSGEGHFGIDHLDLVFKGSRYFLPRYAMHRPAVALLAKGSFYEPRTHDFVRHFCGRFEGSMVHAGTFFGDMLPSFAAAVRGQVHAFEPVLENYVLAKLCLDANGLANVQLFNAALSVTFGNLTIRTEDAEGRHAGGTSTISAVGRICAAMPVDCLGIQDLVLLQLDVEGHELAALRGARRTILRCRPLVAIEDNLDSCAPFLRRHDYHKLGDIPGLSLWAPQENAAYREAVTDFLAA